MLMLDNNASDVLQKLLSSIVIITRKSIYVIFLGSAAIFTHNCTVDKYCIDKIQNDTDCNHTKCVQVLSKM